MTTTKITNRVALTYAIKHLTDAPDEIIEKLTNMVAQLDKKNASPKKLTAQQQKNEIIKAEIAAFLTDHAGESFTVSDLQKSIPSLADKSNQYVSALMRQIVLAGDVEKYTNKRRTYFRVAAGE